jgi:hypothetical protein
VNPSPRERPDWLALAAVAITILVHEILTSLDPRPNLVLIVGASLFWVGYVVVRAWRDPEVFRKWGFRSANLGPACVAAASVFAVFAAGLAIYAAVTGIFRFPPHTLVLMLLYPAWGVIQQFLTLAIVVGNLERVPGLGSHRVVLWLLGSVLFAVVHLYDPILAGGTLVLEMVIIPLYWRYRNLWPLGVLHGWLGALFYLWVRNMDMWERTFSVRL